MSARLFALAAELADAHERSEAGRISVIPVIVEDLRAAAPLLHALTSVYAGRIFEAISPQLNGPFVPTVDPVRIDAVRRELTPVGRGERTIELVDLDGGLIDAQYRDPPAGPELSHGEREVLAVARSFLHQELDDRPIAVVAYSERPMERRFREAFWRVAMSQVHQSPHPVLRTLVLVVEADIDVARHCQPDVGFRYALVSGRLLRRHGADDVNVTARVLARTPGPLVLFLGAGFSASSRMPLGNSLRDSAIERILPGGGLGFEGPEHLAHRFAIWLWDHPEWLTHQERERGADDYARNLTLEQVIRIEKKLNDGRLPTLEEFRAYHNDKVETPGDAVNDLSYIMERRRGSIIIVTVNFDQLVERHARGPVRVFSSDADFRDAPGYLRRYLNGEEEAIPVLKLYGSIEALETCVASAEQTAQGIAPSKLRTLVALRRTQTPLPWVYVGASMRDQDLLPVLRGQEFSAALDERWVSPYLDAAVEEFAQHRESFWKQTPRQTIGTRLISETADAFFRALRREIEAVE